MTVFLRRVYVCAVVLALATTAAFGQAAIEEAKKHIAENRLDDALNVLNSNQEELKDNPELYVTRAMVFLKQEKNAEAEAELNEAIKRDAKHAYAHYYMGMAQSKLKRPDRMVMEYEMFLQLAPQAPEAARVRALLRSI